MRNQQVLLGTRVPLDLKEKLCQYCVSHGIKMSYFVSEAIKERLLEIAEDNRDLSIARARMKSGDFISQKEFEQYVLKRGIKA